VELRIFVDLCIAATIVVLAVAWKIHYGAEAGFTFLCSAMLTQPFCNDWRQR